MVVVKIKEIYLHYLWRKKLIPFHLLSLDNGQEFQIIDYGTYNANESGPDFSLAKIIIDGILWVGPVEIHVKSSDWYLHKHEKDPNYNNVILHFVYENDRKIIQNNRDIPTIALERHLNKVHHQNFITHYYKNDGLFCHNSLQAKGQDLFNQHAEDYLFMRLKRKYNLIEIESYKNLEELLLVLFAKTMGGSINGETLSDFALDYYNRYKQNASVEALLYHWSSHLENHLAWKTKGLRNANNCNDKAIMLFTVFYELEYKNAIDELLITKDYSSFIECIDTSKLSEFSKNNLKINALIPFIFLLRQKGFLQIELSEISCLYTDLDAENHKITRIWKASNISLKNAADTQACLEIYQQFCSKKLCHQCELGKEILNK
jgi:hypothetical protein